MKTFRNLSISYGEDQNLLDSQISWDFPREIVDFSENDFPEVLKKYKKKLELEENMF